jgi:hypothetical protein
MSEQEREAVRTTIVGGRPPGSGRSNMTVPRGIEVLVKKAAVDPAFRERFLEERGAAANDIALDLDSAEAAMLKAIPRQQLVQIIDQTWVPDEQRRAFLGKVATIMLAALGVGSTGCNSDDGVVTLGSEPDIPEPKPKPAPAAAIEGIRPDRPAPATTQTNTSSTLSTRGIQPDRP